jgi:hypothetical protein
MKAAVLPYKLGNTYSKELAIALDGFRINPTARSYVRRGDHRLINWGCSSSHYQFQDGDFNRPEAVANAVNKVRAFTIWHRAGVRCPQFTTDRAEAQYWLSNWIVVYARDRECGARGEGITVYRDSTQQIGVHKLFTKGEPIRREYRIHVGRGRCIDITQKLRRNGHQDANPLVRTAENGWVFCRNNIRTPQAETVNLCIKAVAELGLDFGGVDCCETDFGTAVVFEVNTAPAIEGTTVRHYVDFFKEYLNG